MARNKPKQVAKEVPVFTRKKREKISLNKVASNDVPISRMVLGSQGVDGLHTVNGHIYEHCHYELRWPEAITTYKQMALDPTIAAVHNFYNMMIGRAEFEYKTPNYEKAYDELAANIIKDKETEIKSSSMDEVERSEKLSDLKRTAKVSAMKEYWADKSYTEEDVEKATAYLNYCRDNMESQTWQQFIVGAGSYRLFGFAVAEKIWTTVKTGKYKGRKKWKSLSPRSQETVKRWTWDKNDPDRLTGVVQRSQFKDPERYGQDTMQPERKIDRHKFILFRFDPQKNNPQGTSPLDGCWQAWKYLQLVREYQAIGVAKDLGGVPVIGYPVEKLIEAAADPSGSAAMTLQAIKENAAKLHAGDESFIIKPIDYDEMGNELYSFDLMGIQGGGKQYDTSEIITQYQNEILTCYSASMLKMGQDATGSFALSDNMSNLLAFGVQHHLDIISQQINVDLVPQTLAINGWLFEQEDMPTLTYGDIAPRDLDEVGKFIQRTVTAGAMTAGKNLDQSLRSMADLPEASYEPDDEIPLGFDDKAKDRKVSQDTSEAKDATANHKINTESSAAGKGDGTSGTGNSQSATGGDNNKENK